MPLVLDLQWLLFGLLCAGLVAVAAGMWMYSRRSPLAARTPLRSPASMTTFLDQAPFGVLVLNGASLEYANAEACLLLHLSSSMPQPLPSSDWADLLKGDVAALRQEAAGSDDKAAVPGRYRSVTFASGRTARWWVSPQESRDVVVLLDISAQQRAQQAGRSLVSDLGHELRTPIATLMTHLEILGLDDVSHDVHRQSLQLARRESHRMSRLVNDMLDLGRLEMAETLACRPLNLLPLAEEVVVQVTPQAVERGMALDLVAASSLPLVLGNMDRLRQVFLNLLDNAVKYAGSGARVTVHLDPVASGVRCAVCDTGPGIPAEHLPHITRRFYRAAPDAVEGSGLGLALVVETLRRHDAELEVVSPVSEGRGTCMGFVLPESAPPEGHAR